MFLCSLFFSFLYRFLAESVEASNLLPLSLYPLPLKKLPFDLVVRIINRDERIFFRCFSEMYYSRRIEESNARLEYLALFKIKSFRNHEIAM